MEFNHKPIMLKEVVENLNIKPDGIYVDLTLGGAGHSCEIAKMLSENGILIGVDKDLTAIEVSKARLEKFKCKKIFVHSDFKNLKEILKNNNISKVDGILADLGVSSYQIDEVSRGFSYMHDAPLDMRMDLTSSLTARQVVNNYSEKDLIKILYNYGEESFAKSIVRNIVKYRQEKEIETTKELAYIIEKSYPSKLLHKGGNVCKKTFQAIRIEVNSELSSLESVLGDMIDSLSGGGRLCIITFHSLEDRLVKNCFSENAQGCICPKSFPICVCNHKAVVKQITKKPITPSVEEQKENSRCLSSKLRVVEKL